MKIRDAISLVRTGVREVNADSILPNKYIYNELLVVGRLLVGRESDRLNLMEQQDLFQKLKCIEMEEAPAIDPCCGIKTLCTVWRTKNVLPEMYLDSTGVIIKAISTIDESKGFKLITPVKLLSIKRDTNSKYDKTLYAFYSEGRIYTTNSNFKMIEVEAMFEEDISNLNNCDADLKSCTRKIDSKWRVPKKLQEPIIKEVVNKILNSYKRIPQDTDINKTDKQ
jgi:hypothetical protein